MDYVDFIVHVFLPEKRAFYGLERLRKSATTLSIDELNTAIEAHRPAPAKTAAEKSAGSKTAGKKSATKLSGKKPGAKKTITKKAAAKKSALKKSTRKRPADE